MTARLRDTTLLFLLKKGEVISPKGLTPKSVRVHSAPQLESEREGSHPLRLGEIGRCRQQYNYKIKPSENQK
ncbi:MAG: hypothetical protein A2365_00320 [Candidatus Nealsonbacteria bacterium RIFOXYB1_FULL_40_15]|uniref:Uncharacterized protein n=1 Tax=Candidatus Nealsonbacteria bacterium RIFOXYB1_FULL_40_15 TaxID=1801677 RepID=A0A1G2EM29_9BACT|nr:MAG: hypothetical protein A2365_00320 [Candidatus Nealsonbacteria bacterium RIFOXYB1_FULL_40_15]